MRLLKPAAWILMLSGCVLGCVRSEEPKLALARLSADITFRCLWWSEDQMEGLNPNSPPPKRTEVTIQKWEYTDPVGTPHPDTIDVVVALIADGSTPVTGVSADVSGQWRIGPANSPKNATWSEQRSLQKWQGLTITPGTATVLRVPVNVAGRISELEAKHKWPWGFRVALTVQSTGAAEPVLMRDMELPIRPGD